MFRHIKTDKKEENLKRHETKITHILSFLYMPVSEDFLCDVRSIFYCNLSNGHDRDEERDLHV